VVDAYLRGQGAEGRGEARRDRHEHARDADRVGQLGAVRGARAAEGEDRELARVDPLLHGHDADRVRHVLVRDPHHGRGDGNLVVAEAAQAGARSLGVERDPPSEEEVRVQAAEDDVRVGQRRLLAALP